MFSISFRSLPQIFSSGNSPTPGESPIPGEDEPVINLTEVNGNTVQLSDQDTADQYHSTDSDDHNENQDSQVGNVLKDLGQIAIQVSQTTEATDSEDNKKQTLTDLATKESTSEPTTPVAQRRHTNTSFMPNQGLLAPSGFDRTRRRHSDFVKVPRPLNEEIALRDLQKDLGHRSSVPDAIDFPDCKYQSVFRTLNFPHSLFLHTKNQSTVETSHRTALNNFLLQILV